MSQKKEILLKFNELLIDTYNEHELFCLSDDYYSNCEYSENNTIMNYNLLCVEYNQIYDDYFSEKFDQAFKKGKFLGFAKRELIETTQEIKYRIGLLFLNREFIYRISDHPISDSGRVWYANNPTYFDNRYNYELTATFESVYKFWQRLSDYILIFFPKKLRIDKKNTVSYFHTPYQYIKKEFPQLIASSNFKELYSFSEDYYPELNKKRKFFVHHTGYSSWFFENFLSHNSDREKIQMIDNERKSYPDYLKNQLVLCIEGYYNAMKFLNEVDVNISHHGIEYSLH